MINFLLVTLLLISGVISFYSYRQLYRHKNLFSDRFGFNVALTASTAVSLSISILLFLLHPNIHLVGSINILLGIFIGLLFGSLVNTQTIVAGVYNGGVSGIMGTMIGAVAYDPSICGLPFTESLQQTTVMYFGIGSFILFLLTIRLLHFSLRV
ncbi:hypothetical protein DS745_06820 [Anaerobacillus alkaliphilus]|uniref:Uncharacterized protein n=1 Tax=Anaerobacillus alkaliphilus TaxID=1548597 RepID=A0A4Q0VW89_9BACI|nr:hypothetical protein [Anaerobacillus alkaliphilus]RXJ02411.1 hypothetical protein DS745_06820 [Anaerobacillus alkaliphilus]